MVEPGNRTRERYATIVKRPDGRPHNLRDYAEACRDFTWESARSALDGLGGGALNIAHEAVDRHARSAHADREALRWLGADGSRRRWSYGELGTEVARFAAVLRGLEVPPGARVYTLAGRIPELYFAALGTLKAGCVFCPLFSAFGPEPVAQRMEDGEASVLVTTRRLYDRKVAPVRDRLTSLRHVLIVREPGDGAPLPPGTRDLAVLLADAADASPTARTRPSDPALLHYTSGTTGKPKGVMHVHEAVVAHRATAAYALDLRAGDVFWCTADPGWVTGTSYGIIAPLTLGCTVVVAEAEFEAERWYRTLQDERVSVWYTAPTAVRMLMRSGSELARRFDLSALRFVASVGEPLNPEAVVWSNDVLGMPIHDNWWQTETGGIMIANFASSDVKPGSMGRPLPGIVAAIVRPLDGGGVEVLGAPDQEGELALRVGWPSMFRGYLHREDRYRQCFREGWYLTGDLARVDADGWFWFVGRADDMIKSAGHLIGPFEVESALLEHPAVAEAGVIGKPDPVAGNIVKAFVSLRAGWSPGPDLEADVLGFARKRLGPAVAPRELSFVDGLPKTRSGKIMRRLLLAREIGLPEGDTSTLESTR